MGSDFFDRRAGRRRSRLWWYRRPVAGDCEDHLLRRDPAVRNRGDRRPGSRAHTDGALIGFAIARKIPPGSRRAGFFVLGRRLMCRRILSAQLLGAQRDPPALMIARVGWSGPKSSALSIASNS